MRTKIIKRLTLLITIFVLCGCSDRYTSDESSKLIKEKNETLITTESNTPWDEWIYFGSLENDNVIYKVKQDGTELTKLCTGVIEGVHRLTEWVYYKDSINTYDLSPIKKIKWDGTEDQIVVRIAVDEYAINEKYIIYESNNRVYRANLDGSNATPILVLSSNLYQLQCTENELFIGIDNGIFRMGLDGSNAQQIVKGFSKFKVSGSKLYFAKDDKMICYDLVTNKEMVIFEEANYDTFYYNNNVYYTYNNYLVKRNLSTNETTELFLSTYAYDFEYIDGYIYCFGDNLLWKIQDDLSDREIIYGNGLMQEKSIIAKWDDKIISKSINYNKYSNNENYIYLIEEDTSTKLIDYPVGSMIIDNDSIYFTNTIDRALYRYNLISNITEKIEDLVSEVCIVGNEIYATKLDDSYRLYKITADSTNKLTDTGAYNITADGNRIFYLNRSDKNKLYSYKNGKINLEVTSFTSQYCILDGYIYYRNDDENGCLYRKQIGKDKTEKLTINTVDSLYTDGKQVYYVEINGSYLLYKINNVSNKSVFLKFITYGLRDYIIEDNNLYEAMGVDGGEAIINEINYNTDLKMYVDSSLEYTLVAPNNYICFYEGYLYNYNVLDSSVQLLYNSSVANYDVSGEWVYFSGGTKEDHKSYIKRINYKTLQEELLIKSDKPFSSVYEFLVEEDNVYYLDDSEENILKKYNIKTKNQSELTRDCVNLYSYYRGQLIYGNSKGNIKIIRVDGRNNRPLTKDIADYIALYDNYLYYFVNDTDEYDGKLMKINLTNNKVESITISYIKAWDYALQDNKIYYALNGIKELDLVKQQTKNIYNGDVISFYLDEDYVIAYLVGDGANEYVKISIK